MELLLFFMALPFLSLLVGLVTAWRFSKTGDNVAFWIAAFCVLLGIIYGIVTQHDSPDNLYSAVFVLHGLIALLLLKRPVASLPALWFRWVFVGALLLELLFSAPMQPLWAVIGGIIPSYFGWFVSLSALTFSLLRWLRARHRRFPDLPLSQTYLWGIGLVIAASFSSSLLHLAGEMFRNPDGVLDVFSTLSGNVKYLLFPLFIQFGVASAVIWIATQTFLKKPADSLPAEEKPIL